MKSRRVTLLTAMAALALTISACSSSDPASDSSASNSTTPTATSSATSPDPTAQNSGAPQDSASPNSSSAPSGSATTGTGESAPITSIIDFTAPNGYEDYHSDENALSFSKGADQAALITADTLTLGTTPEEIARTFMPYITDNDSLIAELGTSEMAGEEGVTFTACGFVMRGNGTPNADHICARGIVVGHNGQNTIAVVLTHSDSGNAPEVTPSMLAEITDNIRWK
ncbi:MULTISPECIES: hypothetical protein [unclassified Actinobaculum]|uniref:hypothetical protein n=1 Tax=unclassified Actinobaculum TaxID=2609299 RepID=UPI000D5268A0|nr:MULTISPECIES: hypothetical protein [unclassified Actinobaculum]AWE41912.1 hypothetical protein DDD63_03120 [Actinobaculum sp. 313]RTE50173.1 hypothetical protein EKN07_02840 [Actinobaculum sp. 352]